MRTNSVRQSRASRVVVSTYVLATWACSVFPLFLSAPSANAQALALMPGETHSNIPAAGKVVQSNAPVDPNPCSPGSACPPPPSIGTAVAFGREDPNTQNIYVWASDAIVGFRGVTVARGILFVDFCVPRPGSGTCDNVSDPNAPDITASLTFQYGVIASAYTDRPLADASLGLTGSVVDTEKGGWVAFEDLLRNDLNSHGIQFAPISLDWIPIPLPNHKEAKITQPVTFTGMILKRGRIYRFQLSAAATADGGGYLDAFKTRCDIFVSNCERQRVMLRNLSVTVSQDPAGNLLDQLKQLQDVVSALQGQIGNLVTRIETLETKLQDSISALNQAYADLARRNDRDGHDRHERSESDRARGR